MIAGADEAAEWRQRASHVRESAHRMPDLRSRHTALAIADSDAGAAEMAETRRDRRSAKRALFWLGTVYFCFLAGGATLAVALTIRPIG